MTNEELLSKTISYLRFPLIVGVVFVHNKMEVIDIQGIKVHYDAWPWLTYTMEFFSSILPAICVPLFFFFSGFLFFNNTIFDKEVYTKKLKRRCRTLLIPYLIWNYFGFIILLVQMHPRFESLFPLLKDYRIDCSEFLSYFWMKELPMDPPGERAMPINYPLWFIRDLMLLILASPIIYWLIKKLKIIFIVVMGITWFWGIAKYIGLPGLSHQSIFFFPLGAYFSINHINFVELFKKAKWTPFIYIIFAIADFVITNQPYNDWFHKIGIIMGMIMVIYIASELISNQKAQTSKFLSDASFFVFAFHGLILTKYTKVIIMLFHPQSPYIILFIYFFVPITTILVSLALYKLLNMWLPSIAKIVTGGR